MTQQDIADSPEVKAAVDWWTRKVGAGEFHNGDSSQSALIRRMRAKMPPPQNDSKQSFAAALKRSIADEAARIGFDLTLSVDYHPDHILTSACDAAGIEPDIGVLPAKTRMWIRQGSVTVIAGYGSQKQTIFPAS